MLMNPSVLVGTLIILNTPVEKYMYMALKTLKIQNKTKLKTGLFGAVREADKENSLKINMEKLGGAKQTMRGNYS